MTAGERRDVRADGPVGSRDEFRFDRPFCADALRSDSAERLTDRGVAHLEAHEDATLLPVFPETYGGEDCDDDCGYGFPVGVETVSGFESPTAAATTSSRS